MFSTRLKNLRTLEGMTQQQLASRVGVSTRTIQNYENGASIPRSKGTVDRIAGCFGVPAAELFEPEDCFRASRKEEHAHRKAEANARLLLSDLSALFASGNLTEEEQKRILKTVNGLYWKYNRRTPPAPRPETPAAVPTAAAP
ncbi:MAG: helix-turn-helix transcriptional regulator [Clostridia bacterium]|nr:helix-turn-helix transcriptional regulator [Clostridia bacterium]